VAILRHCTVIYLEKLKENHKNIIAAQWAENWTHDLLKTNSL
jgi:hypothetical protein